MAASAAERSSSSRDRRGRDATQARSRSPSDDAAVARCFDRGSRDAATARARRRRFSSDPGERREVGLARAVRDAALRWMSDASLSRRLSLSRVRARRHRGDARRPSRRRVRARRRRGNTKDAKRTPHKNHERRAPAQRVLPHQPAHLGKPASMRDAAHAPRTPRHSSQDPQPRSATIGAAVNSARHSTKAHTITTVSKTFIVDDKKSAGRDEAQAQLADK